MGIYESLGVTPIINGTGTFTRLGGTLMPPEVVEAMAQASRQFVAIEDLQYRAGQAIAGMVGAEAAYITSGCYAAVVLSVAACITGGDPARMDRLPRTEGMKHEVILLASQRNSYDHAIEVAGGLIVEAGHADGATTDDVAAAITPQTAAVVFWPDWPGTTLTIADIVAVARPRGVPVVVDAAGRLGVPERLKAYVAQKPDLACFSGGKHIRGPQVSGFVCGRADLISAIAWQHLDMDFTPAVSVSPRALLNVEQMPFVPRQGIGRGFKAGKEEIVGLVTALQLFIQRDQSAERARCERAIGDVIAGLAGNPFARAEAVPGDGYSQVRVVLNEAALEMSAYEFCLELKRGAPPIHPSERELENGALVFNPFSLVAGDAQTIARRISEIVARARPG
ncbi:MAG: hypothetical protein HZB53_11310 [Chloroflexi bacterium]|nr:hypothetical protein [Chloroflexota bacterium]